MPPRDWPNATLSRSERGPVHDWHLQETGAGTPILLLHGAGGSVHSFRDLMPALAADFHVLAVDLPGHGYTRLGAQQRSNLADMATDVAALCDTLGFVPKVIIGHSAGAAIALQMTRRNPAVRVIGINPALGHFEGLAGLVFPAMAKLLAATPFSARLFSGASSRPSRVAALIDSTGSQLDTEGLDLYRHLVAQESHVNGALKMMAQWSLDDLLAALPGLTTECLFLTGAQDGTVPASVAETAAQTMPNARHLNFDGYGHLIHEEAPDKIAEACRAFIQT